FGLAAPSLTKINSLLASFSNGTMTEEGLIINLVASAEYFTNSGSNNATWLQRAYQDILGRGGLASGPASLPGRGGLTMGRGAIASALVYSGAGLRRIVDSYYLKYVGRTTRVNTADSALDEGKAWFSQLLATTFTAGGLSPDQVLVKSLLGSPEYFQ